MLARFPRSPPCTAQQGAPVGLVSCPRGAFAPARRRRANDPLASGLLTERPRRTREFTARSCPSRRPVRIRTAAGLWASGIRAQAAIQRRPIKSWAQPHSRRNSAGKLAPRRRRRGAQSCPLPERRGADTRSGAKKLKGSPLPRETNARPRWSAASPWARPCWTSSGTAA